MSCSGIRDNVLGFLIHERKEDIGMGDKGGQLRKRNNLSRNTEAQIGMASLARICGS